MKPTEARHAPVDEADKGHPHSATSTNSTQSSPLIQPKQSKKQQWLWFVGLWVLGVLSITAIAGIFRFFAQFAYH